MHRKGPAPVDCSDQGASLLSCKEGHHHRLSCSKVTIHIAGSKIVYYSQLSIPTSAARRMTPGVRSIKTAMSGAP